MPTDKPRITFTLDETTLKAIDDYKFKYRIKNQSQAILSLMELGMEALEAEKTKPASTADDAYASVSLSDLLLEKEKAPAPEGAEAVSMDQSNRLFDALVAAGLIVDDNCAAQDIQFLGHICDLITDWFASKHTK